jgi:hypothetical protein
MIEPDYYHFGGSNPAVEEIITSFIQIRQKSPVIFFFHYREIVEPTGNRQSRRILLSGAIVARSKGSGTVIHQRFHIP